MASPLYTHAQWAPHQVYASPMRPVCACQLTTFLINTYLDMSWHISILLYRSVDPIPNKKCVVCGVSINVCFQTRVYSIASMQHLKCIPECKKVANLPSSQCVFSFTQ